MRDTQKYHSPSTQKYILPSRRDTQKFYSPDIRETQKYCTTLQVEEILRNTTLQA
jgi:hypothetical protein